jgi:hypothetical protein
VEVTQRLYGVYETTEPSKWDEFLSEGAPESASVCRGALRRDRATRRVVLRLAEEGTDCDGVIEVAVPEARSSRA